MERAKKAFEREFLRHKLATHANDVKRASEALNIRPSTIDDILKSKR
jgi:DNA-binding NtrC family response regulator